MVNVYTGTPGAGKSLHCANMILFHLKHGKRVICNFPINENMIKKKYRKNFLYLPDSEMTPHYLFEFAKAFHKEAKEDQTFIIIDEAQRLFPIDRVYIRRKEWEEFFQLHRHYGFSIILVTQNLSYINKGIRIQTEYEVKHRKVNNYGIGGLILTILHIPLFVALTYWQGTKECIYSDFFLYKKKYGKLYNTFGNFDTGYSKQEENQNKNDIDEREENLNLLFGNIEDIDEMQIDTENMEIDEENMESWTDDVILSEAEMLEWQSA